MKRSNRSKAPWMILCFLALGVGIFLIFHSENNKMEDSIKASSTATPVPTATPQPGAGDASGTAVYTAEPTATPSPVPTGTPTPSPGPTATPTPTPTPTATPAVVTAREGSFRSDSGTYLNIIVRWAVIPEGEKTTLRLDAYVESYALTNAARTGDICFTVNGQKTYADSPAISIANNDLTETPLGSITVDITDVTSLDVTVDWAFNGFYSNKEVKTITASQSIMLY